MKKFFSVVLACLMLVSVFAVAASAANDFETVGTTPLEIAKTSAAPVIDGKFDANEGWGAPYFSVSSVEEAKKCCFNGNFGDNAEFEAWIADPAHIPFGVDLYMRWDDTAVYFCAVEKIASRNTDWGPGGDVWNSDGLIVTFTNGEDECDELKSRWNFNLLDDGAYMQVWEDTYDLDPEGGTTFAVTYDAGSQTQTFEFSSKWANILEGFTAKEGAKFYFRDMLIPVTADSDIGDPIDFVTAGYGKGTKSFWEVTLASEPVVETEAPAAETVAEGGDVVAPVNTNTKTADTVAALAVVCVLAAGAVVAAKKKF